MTTIMEIDKQIATIVAERADIEAKLTYYESIKDANTALLKDLIAQRETIAGKATKVPAGDWTVVVSYRESVDADTLSDYDARQIRAVGATINARDKDAIDYKAGTSKDGLKMLSATHPCTFARVKASMKTIVTFRLMAVKH